MEKYQQAVSVVMGAEVVDLEPLCWTFFDATDMGCIHVHGNSVLECVHFAVITCTWQQCIGVCTLLSFEAQIKPLHEYSEV